METHSPLPTRPTPTMPERMSRIETLISDPDLGLIAHVTRVDRKVDDGLAGVNDKLDQLLAERSERKPLWAAARYAATAFIGALAFYLVRVILPNPT